MPLGNNTESNVSLALLRPGLQPKDPTGTPGFNTNMKRVATCLKLVFLDCDRAGKTASGRPVGRLGVICSAMAQLGIATYGGEICRSLSTVESFF